MSLSIAKMPKQALNFGISLRILPVCLSMTMCRRMKTTVRRSLRIRDGVIVICNSPIFL